MILELLLLAQDTDHGPVADDQILYLPVTSARRRVQDKKIEYYVELPVLPPEDAIEVPGTIQAYYEPSDRTLRISWEQSEGVCSNSFPTGVALKVDSAKALKEFPWNGR